MTNFQRLKAFACLCTIASFCCSFFGITAESLRKSGPPSNLAHPEVITHE